jgi:hypothetical protein
MMRPVGLEIVAGDFAFAAGHGTSLSVICAVSFLPEIIVQQSAPEASAVQDQMMSPIEFCKKNCLGFELSSADTSQRPGEL